VTTGYPTEFLIPMNKSSPSAAKPGTSSLINLRKSCQSAAENGRMGSN